MTLTNDKIELVLPRLRRYAANMSMVALYQKRELLENAFKHVFFLVPIQSRGTREECYLCIVWIEKFVEGQVLNSAQIVQT